MTLVPSIDVVLHAGPVQQTVTLPTPPALGAQFEVDWIAGNARIHVATERPMTQAIAWLGTLDDPRPRWTSEQATELHLRLPRSPTANRSAPIARIG